MKMRLQLCSVRAVLVLAAISITPSCVPAGSTEDSAADQALAFRGAARPLPGLVTGGQPDSATFAALAAEGVRVVLDIRTPGEPRGLDEARVVESLGMRYRSLPVSEGLLDEDLFEAFRLEMAAADSGAIVVHCASGNRVGGMMIPWLMLDRGKSAREADSLAQVMGLRSGAMREAAHAYVRAAEPPR